jgi:hypothetical protein
LNETVIIRKSDLCRGKTEFKKGHQAKSDLVKVERGDLLADPKKNLTR